MLEHAWHWKEVEIAREEPTSLHVSQCRFQNMVSKKINEVADAWGEGEAAMEANIATREKQTLTVHVNCSSKDQNALNIAPRLGRRIRIRVRRPVSPSFSPTQSNPDKRLGDQYLRLDDSVQEKRDSLPADSSCIWRTNRWTTPLVGSRDHQCFALSRRLCHSVVFSRSLYD